MSQSAPSNTESNPREWLSMVQSRQKSRITPEKIEEIKTRVARHASVQARVKKARRLERSAVLNNRTFFSAVKSAIATPLRAREEVQEAQCRMQRIQTSVESHYEDANDYDRCGEAEDLESAKLDLLEAELAQQDERVAEADPVAAIATDDALLSSLRKEPTTDDECAAKFTLYEKFHETVVSVRKQVYSFYFDEAKSLFEGAGQAQVEQDLKNIDKEDNLGISNDDFSGSEWFVYHMAIKSHTNGAKIGRVLESIHTKLELMDSQDECPVCFEKFGDDIPATTLGCCHKVCDTCWSHWRAIHNSCPLCRHEEFLEFILREQ